MDFFSFLALDLRVLTFYAGHLVSVVTTFMFISVKQSKVQREVENIQIVAKAKLTNKYKDNNKPSQESPKHNTLHK